MRAQWCEAVRPVPHRVVTPCTVDSRRALDIRCLFMVAQSLRGNTYECDVEFDADEPEISSGSRQKVTRRKPVEMSTTEAAAVLRVTERTVRRAIARGELRANKLGASYRISPKEVERYAARLEQHAPPGAGAGRSPWSAPDQYLSPLPVPLSSFVGREANQAALTAL